MLTGYIINRLAPSSLKKKKIKTPMAACFRTDQIQSCLYEFQPHYCLSPSISQTCLLFSRHLAVFAFPPNAVFLWRLSFSPSDAINVNNRGTILFFSILRLTTLDLSSLSALGIVLLWVSNPTWKLLSFSVTINTIFKSSFGQMVLIVTQKRNIFR